MFALWRLWENYRMWSVTELNFFSRNFRYIWGLGLFVAERIAFFYDFFFNTHSHTLCINFLPKLVITIWEIGWNMRFVRIETSNELKIREKLLRIYLTFIFYREKKRTSKKCTFIEHLCVKENKLFCCWDFSSKWTIL